MTGPRRFVVPALVLLALSVPATGQDPGRRAGVLAPPVPDGPTLEVPPESRPPSGPDDGPHLIPAGATDVAGAFPADGSAGQGVDWLGRPCVAEAMTSSSACQFDVWRPDGVFACGTTSVQVLSGAYFSTGLGPDNPRFNYVPVSVRYGWMLTDPADSWLGRGNYELLCDTTAAAVTTDYGNWLAGQSYYLRYNFVEPGATVVPYQQVGIGWLFNDAYRDRTQEAIGRSLEFRVHYEIGLKCFVTPNLSLDVEGGIQHISNAGLARRNHGVNALGAQVGFTYYFPAAGQ